MMDYLPGTEVFKGNRVGFLLLHGLAGSPVELRFMAQSLNRAGHTVVLPLMAGHGTTLEEFGRARWTEWVVSAELALERMSRDCDTIIIGGISTGAVVALRLAATRKDLVQGVSIFAPTFWPNGWAIPKSMHLFKLIKQRWLANLFTLYEQKPYGIKDDRLRRMVLDNLTSDGKTLDEVTRLKGGALFEFHRLGKDVRKRLSEVTQPTLVVHPREDDQSDLSNAFMVLRGVRGRVETLVLEDSYHMVVLDRQRQRVAERTIAFAKALIADNEAIVERQRWRTAAGA